MKQGLSQEGLKLLACITMLMDHVGAVLLPWQWLRIAGRLSFPIFCFLIAEGAFHTRHPGKYALRLALAAVISEIPFDLCFFGAFSWHHQNVMITLLLGFGAVYAGKDLSNFALKFLAAVPFVVISRFLKADYGMEGVLLILLFGMTRELRFRELIQLVLMFLLFFERNGWPLFTLLGLPITLQMTCVTSMVPISLYTGEKLTRSKWIQWGFYLFYPVHMLVLAFAA